MTMSMVTPTYKVNLWEFNRGFCNSFKHKRTLTFSPSITPRASLTERPLLWAGRLFVFYVLIKSGIAGGKSGAQGMPGWLKNIIPGNSGRVLLSCFGADLLSSLDPLQFMLPGEPVLNLTTTPQSIERKSIISKWKATTKGTLKRSYRVPSKAEGLRLLKAISFLLSEDDTFTDAASHKGCQIRRENAHAQSVCCNNVRALFDELPTPHLIIEITPFPIGFLSDRDYVRAEKIEKTLKRGPSI